MVNGYDRIGMWGTTFDVSEAIRYPWLDVCLREVGRRSKGTDHEVFVWDNSQLPELRAIARRRGAHLWPTDEQLAVLGPEQASRSLALLHAESLRLLLTHVGDDFEYVVTLDTDAFPISDGWLETLKFNLQSSALTGVWRDEMEGWLSPFVHPSCLAIRRDRLLEMDDPFSLAGVQDVGQWITNDVLHAGESIQPLRRSNARNAHFLIGGIYGDTVYHQAAGSRRPVFRLTQGEASDYRVFEVLRDLAFTNLDHLVAVLRGVDDDDLGLDWNLAPPARRTEWMGQGPRDAKAEGGGLP